MLRSTSTLAVHALSSTFTLIVLALFSRSALAGPGASKAPAPRAPFVWPMPDVLETVEMPGVSVVAGVPVRLHVIHVKHSAEEMLQRYATAFDQAGFFIDPKQKRRFAQPHLTALDPITLISHTVILQPHPDGTTTCILGEANLRNAQRAEPPSDARLMPGAKAVITVQQEGSSFLSYEVAAKESAVRQHFRAALPREGWQQSQQPGEEDVFNRGRESLRLLLRGADSGKTSVVLVHHG